jgi:hypothetical protein
MGKSVQSVCKLIIVFCFFVNKWTKTNFHLQDEQTAHGLRTIAWASVFRLKQQYIYIYLYI